ncbi:hypothetical protein HPP92_025642 [Vanilla planifolia]|uniref:DUF1279 domain-containing protein n=1 Tax=Vanilla planifolia TaxID=51239 RepID=A0A835U9S5_VANPL|nr:hypothetical protein HPP92_025899 [Vanilla planifolia]KAG0454338.1 hypothetical protein HPP92_025642 [Vanilla planifolia]
MVFAVRLRDMMKKYGKMAVGIHLSVSAASIAGLYTAIRNNINLESHLERIGQSPGAPHQDTAGPDGGYIPVDVIHQGRMILVSAVLFG